MKSIKAPKSAVLEVLAQEPLRLHTKQDIANSFATVVDGELSKPSTSTIYQRIKELLEAHVDILTTLQGYLLVPKDPHLWTSELYIAVAEAEAGFEAFSGGNAAVRERLTGALRAIPEGVKRKQIV